MSDAMSNREIEDVLTSIRRLVAQEGGRGSQAGRLILTEAQRVLDAADRDGTESAQDNKGDTPGGTVPRSSVPTPDFGRLEATIAELEAAVAAVDEDDWENGATGAAANPVRPAASASNVTELYARSSLSARARVEPESAASDAAPEGAGHALAATGGVTGDDATGESVTLEDDAVSRSEALSADQAPIPPEAAMDDSAMDDEALIAAVVETVDPLIEASELEADPESAAAGDAGAVEGAGEDHPPHAEDRDGIETGLEEPLDDLAAILDEETLRVMVAQIVREELHGQLGERITQQVRKLVRAEIARALADRTYL